MIMRKLFLNFVFLAVFVGTLYVSNVNAGETCRQSGTNIYCEYGCCGSGSDQKCCSISTSVLVVACVVSGLVLIALVCAIVICCWKNYQDKQASRVRRLRQEELMNAPRNPGVEPPKPPSYISAPPAYSEEMPESHFRPPTVSGHIPYNQRFRGTTPVPRAPVQGSVHVTSISGSHPTTHSRSFRTTHIPGAVEIEAPPPYTEFARGRTPADRRRRRFIQTPVQEREELSRTQVNRTDAVADVSDSTSSDSSDESVRVETRVAQSSAQHVVNANQSRNQNLSRAGQSRASTSRELQTRTVESRSDMSRAQETRAESVARILGSRSRISRIPTRVHGMNTNSAHTVSTSQNRSASTNARSGITIQRTGSVQEENIEELAII